jgi:putative membrane protein
VKVFGNSASRLLVPLAAAVLIFSARGFAGSSSLGGDDTDFVKKAAKGGMAEVEMGRLAAQKGVSPEVKAFGNRMVRDHTKANHELQVLAASKGVDLPKSKSMGEDVSMAHLKMLSGKSFDEAYIKMMVDDHKEDVADFQKAADGSQDPAVKRFAAKALPTLQSHLSKIEEIQSGYTSGGK